MAEHRKTLKQLKEEARLLGYGVRKWSALAGLPWQSVYRKLSNERLLRMSEYDLLVEAVDRMKQEGQ